jgi:hypothetical protein
MHERQQFFLLFSRDRAVATGGAEQHAKERLRRGPCGGDRLPSVLNQ